MSSIHFNPENTINSNLGITDAQAPQKTGSAKDTPPPAKEQEQRAADSPQLAAPKTTSMNIGSLPSMGAAVLALIQEISAEQRKITNEQRNMQTELAVDKLGDIADKMKEKAITQLCVGIAAGTVSIAQGVASTSMTAKGINSIDKTFNTDGTLKQNMTSKFSTRNNAEMMLNTKIQSFNSSMGGCSGMMNSISQAVGGIYDSEIKNEEANLERIHSMSDQLKSLDDALRELIQKALSTQDQLQQSINQSRTKILG